MNLLANDLASMLVFGGFMPPEAQDDPEGYDACRTMEKVGYLCDLINSKIGSPPSAALREALELIVAMDCDDFAFAFEAFEDCRSIARAALAADLGETK